uniref:Uncharacterized protein n=1 Tax=Oryza brachyantha TaxID=4533 RepID=J3LGI1_ORYBR
MEGKSPDTQSWPDTTQTQPYDDGKLFADLTLPPMTNVWRSMVPPKTNVGNVLPYKNYYFLNVKKAKFPRSCKDRTRNNLLLFVIITSPFRHHLSHTSFQRRGSAAGHNQRAHQHQQWHGGCWHQHP